jgi:hypothetical protein
LNGGIKKESFIVLVNSKYHNGTIATGDIYWREKRALSKLADTESRRFVWGRSLNVGQIALFYEDGKLQSPKFLFHIRENKILNAKITNFWRFSVSNFVLVFNRICKLKCTQKFLQYKSTNYRNLNRRDF